MSEQKIFFSYSRSDSGFALKLAKDLREAGADIWIDQLDIAAGSHWDSAVEKALNTAACVLVILTPASTASTNVMDEVSFALESGRKIIPVLLDDCLAPFRLRRLQRIDFTTDYNAGFKQLVHSLELQIPDKTGSVEAPSHPIQIPVTAPDDSHKVKVDKERKEKEMWEEACRHNTIEAYKKYMHEAITGEYKAEAKLLITQLEVGQKEAELESLLWEKAKEENSIQLYQHYLQEYQHGNYKTLALAAIADIERAEKEELRRTKELEKQQERERAQREKEEKEKALREKQEKEKEIQLQKEKERQLQKEKEQREKEEREKVKQAQREQEQKEKQERERVAKLQREKELQEKQARDKEKQLEKERLLLEKQQAKEKALKERQERGEPAESGSSKKKYAMIGGGVLLVVLGVWAIVAMSSGKGDRETWKEAMLKNDSTAYANYQHEFPEGKYFEQAKVKIDSLFWVKKYYNDSIQEARAKFVTDSLQKAKAASKTTPTKTEEKKVEPTTKSKTTTPEKSTKKLALGQMHQGGIIVHLNAAGNHGMLASVKEVGNVSWDKAGKICEAYRVDSYAGWKLPSKEELNILYQNRNLLGNYTKGIYWSSTEETKNNAWIQNFANGNQGKSNKQSTNAVRAVRPF